MTRYKIILDEGKPFEVLTTSEKNLKKILKDFYVKNTSETFEHYFDAKVFRFEYGENFKGWIEISETQFIQEIISEIIEENGIDNLDSDLRRLPNRKTCKGVDSKWKV
jgi:hypothetical protein